MDIRWERGTSLEELTEVNVSILPHVSTSRNCVEAAVKNKDDVSDAVGCIFMIKITARL